MYLISHGLTRLIKHLESTVMLIGRGQTRLVGTAHSTTKNKAKVNMVRADGVIYRI
jgi:hypothetical protein